MGKLIPTEAQEQSTLIKWANLQEGKYPELRWLHHIPNGGSRHPIEAVNLKRQGVKAGVPDLFLPYASGKYHGLYIEMKSTDKNARLSKEQKEWRDGLIENGYKFHCCKGFEEAKDAIIDYLERGK